MWLENVRAVFCVDGRLDNFLFWAVVNIADMSICIYVCTVFGVCFSLVYGPSSGVAWS